MGFKAKARKAEAEAVAKAKETANWVKTELAEQDLSENQEVAEEARKRAMAIARAEAKAKADAEGKAVADAENAKYLMRPEGKAYPNAKLRQEYRRYYARLKETGPFDLDIIPYPLMYGMLGPCFYHESKAWRPQVDRCVLHAIEFAKKYKKMQLEDPKVVRAFNELKGGFMFYITFDARDIKSGVRRLYEAKVLIECDYIRRPDPNLFCPTYVRLMRVKKKH